MGAKANSPGAEPIKLDREKTNEVVGLSDYVTLKSFKDGWERDWEVLCVNLLSALKFFGDKVRVPLKILLPSADYSRWNHGPAVSLTTSRRLLSASWRQRLGVAGLLRARVLCYLSST